MDIGEFSVMKEARQGKSGNLYCNGDFSHTEDEIGGKEQQTGLKPSVLVMLSAYNGERYLIEQIESILGQTDVEVTLVIRDDVSNDGTRKILSEYENKKNIEVWYGTENLGPGESFMSMFYGCFEKYGNYDYYAFSDQDDVWISDKLSRAVEMIQSEADEYKSALYCSNQMLYESGNQVGYRFKTLPDLTLVGHMNRNLLSGCTFVMNRKLVKIICNSEHAGEDIIARRMHDAWIMLCTIVCGSVVYDQESRILYRIHENNVVGIKKVSIGKAVKNKWNNLTNKNFGNIRMKTAIQLLRTFPEVEGRNREILELYANYRKGRKYKKRLLKDKEIMESLNGVIPGWIKVLFNTV